MKQTEWEKEVKNNIGSLLLAVEMMQQKGINEFGSRNPNFDELMAHAGDAIDKCVKDIGEIIVKAETDAKREETDRFLTLIKERKTAHERLHGTVHCEPCILSDLEKALTNQK